MRLKHIDLFSGIGGFSYALDTVFYGHEIEHSFVEFNEFCQAALRKHWPKAAIHGDIRTFTNTKSGKNDGREGRELATTEGRGESGDPASWSSDQPFILTGGFPCQPFSAAGRRKGTADDRHLWPEMRRVVREFQPLWVVAENVRGLVTWNDGLVLEQVCIELESEGYEVAPPLIIPAVAVNAPHRRDRVWIIANRRGERRQQEPGGTLGDESSNEGRSKKNNNEFTGQNKINSNATDPDTGRIRRHERPSAGEGAASRSGWESGWLEVATELCQLYDGVPDWMDRCFNNIISNNDYGQTIKREQSENLRILQEKISAGEIRKELGGQHPMEQEEILLAFLRRIQRESNGENSVFGQSKKTTKGSLRELWNDGEARRSPRRWEYQKQLARKLKNIVPQLPHEIALEIAKSWDCLWIAYSGMSSLPARMGDTTLSRSRHRKEQLKAYGNAIVPQVAMRIFEAIKSTL